MALTAKFVFGDDVRRASVPTVSVDALVAAATEVFASQLSNPFDLLYADDEGDLCGLVPETFGDWVAQHEGRTCASARFHIRIRNEKTPSAEPRAIDGVPDVPDVPESPGLPSPESVSETTWEEFTIYSDCDGVQDVAETTSTFEPAHGPKHSDMRSTLPLDLAVPAAGGDSAETKGGCQQEEHEPKPNAEVQNNQVGHKMEEQAHVPAKEQPDVQDNQAEEQAHSAAESSVSTTDGQHRSHENETEDHCFIFLMELHDVFSNTADPTPVLIELVPKALQFLQGREAMVDSEAAKRKKYIFPALWALANCLDDYFPEFSGPSFAFKRVLRGGTTKGLGAVSVDFFEKMASLPTEMQGTIFAVLGPCLAKSLSVLGPPLSWPSQTPSPTGSWQIPHCFVKGTGKAMGNAKGKGKGKGKWKSKTSKESYYPDQHDSEATADSSQSGDDSLSSDSSDVPDTPSKHSKNEWNKARKDLKQKFKAQIKALKQQNKQELFNLKNMYMEDKEHGACSRDSVSIVRKDALRSLADMGFNDRKLNLRLLDKHSDHLGRVIDSLVHGEQR